MIEITGTFRKCSSFVRENKAARGGPPLYGSTFRQSERSGLLYLGLDALGLGATNSQSVGHPHEFGERFGAHFPHHMAAVHLYRDFGDTDFGCDLLVHESGSDQYDHLLFARREGIVAGSDARPRLVAVPPRPVAVEPELHGIEQLLVAKRLGEKLHRPGL